MAAAAGVPLAFLKDILGELKKAGIVASSTGPSGGYWMALSPEDVSLAKVIASVDGSSLVVGGHSFRDFRYPDDGDGLSDLWNILGSILDGVSVADVRAGLVLRRLQEALGSEEVDPGLGQDHSSATEGKHADE